jgi:NIPSNAP
LFVANGEDETIRHAINQSVRAKSGLAIVKTIVSDDRENIEIDPARERHAVLRQVDRFLGRIEVNHYCIYNLLANSSSRAGVPCDHPLKTAFRPAAINAAQEKGGLPMIYEIRVYRCLPGRLPALMKRFETITLKLWEKHGIKQAGFFTTLVGESNQELTYFLAWESLADREKKWGAFATDPEWLTARAKTEEDGQIVSNIVNQLLVPTSFSAVK